MTTNEGGSRAEALLHEIDPSMDDTALAPNRDTTAPAADITHALERAVADARRQLAQDEDDYRRVQDELQLVLSSRARRWLLRLRERLIAAARLVVVPWRAVQAAPVLVSRVGARWGRWRDLPAAVRHRSVPLRHLPQVECVTDQPVAGEAIRWLGPTTVAGQSRQALFCHPNSSVTIEVREAAGATLVAFAALLPAVWKINPDGVEFILDAGSEDGSWHGEVRRHVHPRVRIGDRRWRRLRLRIADHASGPVLVRLTTNLRHADSPDSAWALWGEPTVNWRRGVLEGARAGRVNLRRFGLRGTLAKLRDLAGRDEERARFRRWIELNTPSADALRAMMAEAASLPWRPLISVITPVYNTEPRWLVACIESVRRQIYSRWELCIADDASTSEATREVLRRYAGDSRIKITRLDRNQHISAASNAALATATGEFVAMLDHDDELAPEALLEVARTLNARPDADFVYSDEDKLDVSGARCDPYFKPDWSPELFRSFMYTNHLMVLRRALVDEVGRFRVGFEGSQDYDLALRVIERTDRVVHVPKILYHWRKIPGSAAAEADAKPWALKAARRALTEHLERSGADAEVTSGVAPGLFRVRHRIRGNPLVTVVLPTADRTRDVNGREMRLLTNCLRSIVQKTTYSNYEVLVVDNGRLSDESASLMATVRQCRRVSYSYSGAFNFPHKLNFAVRHARGEHLVVFNDDLEVISSEWMTAMLEFSQQPEIGAVGAKLLFPDGRLQHIGMVLGVCGVAAHAFHMAPGSSAGYAGGANTIRNYSCVTGACLMTRRAVFDQVGGFNERLAIDFNDVDYCLRLRQAGYRIVYTPYAQLYHLEGSSLAGREQTRTELDEMRRAWGAAVENDPYYNPNLTRDFPDHRIGV
jgi:GT2 family glycosyltransferase